MLSKVLKTICLFTMTDLQMKSISVEELLRSGKVSRKTYHILVKARMRSLSDLHKYHHSLRRLFRTTSSGLKEIDQLLEEVREKDMLPLVTMGLFPVVDPSPSKSEMLLDGLDPVKMMLLKVTYQEQIRHLYQTHGANFTRLANVLSGIDCEDFIRHFLFEDNQKMMMVKDVGRMSLTIITQVKKALFDEIDVITQGAENLSLRLFNKQYCNIFQNDPFARDYFDRYQHPPVLYALQRMLIASKDLDEINAFLRRYDIVEGQERLVLTPLGKSEYTVKTYADKVSDALFLPGADTAVLGSLLSALYDHDAYWQYLHGLCRDEVLSTQSSAFQHLIREEHLSLLPDFVLAVLGKVLSEEVVLTGRDIWHRKMPGGNTLRHLYLVPRNLSQRVDFIAEFDYFCRHVYDTNMDSRSFDLGAYIASRPFASHQAELIAPVSMVLKTLLREELSLEEDQQGHVVLPMRLARSLSDRLYKILLECQQPASLDQLTKMVNSDGGREYVRSSVSLALNRDSRFVNKGKTGMFALREWHLPYFGSNAEIVREVLSASERPMTADEVIAVLGQYAYNAHLSKNDFSAVVSQSRELFVRFGHGLYGLPGKDYDPRQVDAALAEKKSRSGR